MESKEIASITFVDADSGDDGIVIVRRCGEVVGICLSLRTGSDAEVFLDRCTARKVVEAIKSAINDQSWPGEYLPPPP